jgi:hypothetical protein
VLGRASKKRRIKMKRTLLIVIIVLLLVPVVLYLAAPEVLVGLAIDLERKSAGLSKDSVVGGSGEGQIEETRKPTRTSRN